MKLTPEQRELLQRYITIDGDGNVIGDGNNVRVIKQSAIGDYTVQIGEQHVTINMGDLHPAPSPPFMVEPLKGFVERPEEFERLLDLLLTEDRTLPVGITAALRGAGGYGKTTLTRALCHDPRIRETFLDGILWVTLGQSPDVLGGLRKLYAALTAQRPEFVDVEDAANALAAELVDRACLMVIDDVWNAAHLRPFLRGGARCVRLVTTRDGTTLPPSARTVDVDAMQQDEAVTLLGMGLPSVDPRALRTLAKHLGEWPLLLKLVNGRLCFNVERGQAPDKALVWVQHILEQQGVTGFDECDAEARDQAVAQTVGLSLELLRPEERAHYGKLAIFPEDTDVPLSVLDRLWGMDRFETHALCERLWRLALLLRFDLANATICLHDVMRAYLVREHASQLPAYHARLLDAYAEEVKVWSTLSPQEPYLWHHLVYHLHAAGRDDELQTLLLDFDWLQAKLEATDVNALLADYEIDLAGKDGREMHSLVQSTIRLSAHILLQDETQLPGQLLGRLSHFSRPELCALLEKAIQWRGTTWLRPLAPTLTPPGGSLFRTLTGHTAAILVATVTADGRRAVSGANDRTLRVWNLETGEILSTLTGHTEPVQAVAVTPDGRRVVSGSTDRSLKVWDILAILDTSLATGKIVSEATRTLEGHTDSITSVAVTPDGQRAISASNDKTLKVWDLETGKSLYTLRGHTHWVTSVAMTQDGRRAVSASNDKMLKVWDLETGTPLCTLREHTSPVKAVAMTPDGRYAVSGSYDKTLRVWNLETGEVLHCLTGHSQYISAVAITSDGKLVVSASADSTLIVWDLVCGKALATLMDHSEPVNAVAMTPNGRRAVSGAFDDTLKVWDLASVKAVRETARVVKSHRRSINAVAVTPDGQRAVSASRDKTLKVWDLESRLLLRTLSGHRLWVMAVTVTPDGQRVVSGSLDRTLKVWDISTTRDASLESGKPADEATQTLAGHTEGIFAVAVTPDGQRAVSASQDKTLKVWDLESGEALHTLTGHSAIVRAVAVTPDGRRAVSGSGDKNLKVWDLESGKALCTLTGHTEEVMTVTLTLDGRQVISGSGDKTLKVWDLESGETLHTLVGHDGAVWAVAATPDGRYLVSASRDKTLKMWDLGQNRLLATFSTDSALATCAIASNGLILAGGRSGRIHLLSLVKGMTNSPSQREVSPSVTQQIASALSSGLKSLWKAMAKLTVVRTL
jgi:WD40 repeat protein